MAPSWPAGHASTNTRAGSVCVRERRVNAYYTVMTNSSK